MNNNQFAKDVKKALIDRDETQTHMADKLGLSRQWVNAIILGHKEHAATKRKIEEYLGLV